ncbi:MAG: cytochrome-c peroxidase [Myxococcota bacterium]
MTVQLAGALEFSAEEIRKIAQHSPLGPPPPDLTNAFAGDPGAARLGQFLFFDKRLSAQNDVSCATCHDPRRGFANAAARGSGTGGLATARHVPTLLNNAYNRWFFWDGRADSAWSQATQPLEIPSEHGADRLQIVHLASRTPEIRSSYEAVFGKLPDLSDPQRFPAHAAPMPDDLPRARAWKGMSAADRDVVDRVFTNLTKAIAAYERALVSRDSAFDRFVAQLVSNRPEAASALSESAQRGLRLFIGRGNCRLCHSGPNFSDGEFHDTALPRSGGLRDTGRWGGSNACSTIRSIQPAPTATAPSPSWATSCRARTAAASSRHRRFEMSRERRRTHTPGNSRHCETSCASIRPARTFLARTASAASSGAWI